MPPELVAFCEAGRSLLLGTASAAHEPDCVRCVGIVVWPDASHVTVLVPAATGATSIANLRENPRFALTLSQIHSHRTMQMKGRVLAVRDGTETDRRVAERYRTAFAHELATVGQPLETTERLGIWPCFAFDAAIEMVFAQTPGPQAGARMPVEVKTL